jgi:hypothetical protein
MKRRAATGWILKSAIFTPGLISAIPGCRDKIEETVNLLVLDQQQFDQCNAIADTILPKTDSPSASEVRVVEFIDLLMHDVWEAGVTDSFIAGLKEFEEACISVNQTSFAGMKQEQKTSYLEPIDQQVMREEYGETIPFYYTFKRLCLTVYYSSEQGVKQNLDYQPVPGAYQADIELKTGDKIMVGNQM